MSSPIIKAYLRLSRSLKGRRDDTAEPNPWPMDQIRIMEDHESVELVSKGKSQILQFDHCFLESSTNYEVYVKTVEPILHRCLRGVHGTVFCCEFSDRDD
jgi:hypothetical protein